MPRPIHAPVSSRTLVGARPLAWIDDRTSEDGLTALFDTLTPEPRLALDLEADSFHRYRERLCLLQISAPRRDFLIDPLSRPLDVPMVSLMGAPDRTWVLHGGDSDVLLLHRTAGVRLGRIFDTHVAARLLGLAKVGLKALLEDVLGIAIQKDEQRSDWGRRPLTEEQKAYARDDTAWLLPLAARLEEALRARGRLSWLEEECATLRLRTAAPKVFDPEAWRAIRGANQLPDRAQRVLRAAFLWRERVAESLDRAAFRVATPERLVQLAEKVAATPAAAGSLIHGMGWGPGVPARELPEVLRSAMAEPVPPREPAPRTRGGNLTEAQKRRVDALRALRDERATVLGLEPAIVLSSAQIEGLARAEDPERLAAEVGNWRWSELGAEIQRTLNLGRSP